MARIEVADANAWTERTKLTFNDLDSALLTQIENIVLARIGTQIDASTWISPATTPSMIKTVIAMLYVAWYYDRTYSEDQEQGNDYAALLRAQAEVLLVGILDGSVNLPEVPDQDEPGGPSFYPTDDSSALCPTAEDPSLGPASFSMGFRY
jgi:hypothetical protein